MKVYVTYPVIAHVVFSSHLILLLLAVRSLMNGILVLVDSPVGRELLLLVDLQLLSIIPITVAI